MPRAGSAAKLTMVLALGLVLTGSWLRAQEGSLASGSDSDTFWLKPLQSRNQFPILLLFLVLEPDRAVSLGRGEGSFNLDLSLTNIIKSSIVLPEPSAEKLVLDYEWWRMQAQYQLGLGRGWEAGVSLPLYYRSGGFLDPFISDFHEIFGFPNSVRRATPPGLFRYELVIDGVRVLGPISRGMAAGDLVLGVKKSWRLPGVELGLRAAVKAPTGSWRQAAGSGGFDLGLGFILSGAGRRFGYALNANYYVLGPSSIPDLVPRNSFSLVAALELLLSRRVALIAQVDSNSRFVDVPIPILERGTGQLTTGLRWRFARRMAMEFRFTEDLALANPDFTFGLRVEFLTGRVP